MNESRDGQIMPILMGLLRDSAGIAVAENDRGRSFMDLGLDSLFLTQFSVSVNNRFGASLTFRQIASELDSLTKLAAYLEGTNNQPAVAAATQARESVPIDSEQADRRCDEIGLTEATPLGPGNSDPLIRLFLSQIAVIQRQLDALSGVIPRAARTDSPGSGPAVVSSTSGGGAKVLRSLEADTANPLLDAARPPVPGARLGRDSSGKPAWFVPKPGHPGKYIQHD